MGADEHVTDAQPTLTDLLRCPHCDAQVAVGELEAVCVRKAHRFPVVDGVVVMTDESALASNPHYAQQRRYFDAEFSQLDGYALENWRVSYLTRLRQADLLSPNAAPLVDVGVGGSGFTVIEAARAGAAAIGCDLSLVALQRARRLAVAEGIVERTLWVCCSAERLPFAEHACGAVLAIAVLEHVPDDEAAMREAARVLRRGGRMWITVPHALQYISRWFRWPNRIHDRRLGHLRRYTADTLIEEAQPVGLAPLDVQYTGHAIKAVQLAVGALLPSRIGNRFWWWCEKRDLRRRNDRRGSMQLSLLLRLDGDTPPA